MLSEEYLAARNQLLKSQMGGNLNASQLSSQRILKVVNIIGSKSKDGTLSSNRVSIIRSKHYKSRGEKVTFKHTQSRESLPSTQELALQSGFIQVKLGSEMSDEYNFGNFARQNSVLSHDQSGFNTSKARKNLLLLSNQGSRSRVPPPQSSNAFYPTDSRNLNKLLSEMDKADENNDDGDNDIDENPFGKMPQSQHVSQQKKNEFTRSMLPQSIDLNNVKNSDSLWQRDTETPVQVSNNNFNLIKQSSLNKTTDIFKRTGSSFYTNEAISPRNLPGQLDGGQTVQPSGATMNFEELISQQRDPLIIEKIEQQMKLQQHRKNSASRQSVESQKKKEREESIKARRQRRKQMAAL